MTPISTMIHPMSRTPALIAQGLASREPRHAAIAAEVIGAPTTRRERTPANSGLPKGSLALIVEPKSIDRTARPREPATAPKATTPSALASPRRLRCITPLPERILIHQLSEMTV